MATDEIPEQSVLIKRESEERYILSDPLFNNLKDATHISIVQRNISNTENDLKVKPKGTIRNISKNFGQDNIGCQIAKHNDRIKSYSEYDVGSPLVETENVASDLPVGARIKKEKKEEEHYILCLNSLYNPQGESGASKFNDKEYQDDVDNQSKTKYENEMRSQSQQSKEISAIGGNYIVKKENTDCDQNENESDADKCRDEFIHSDFLRLKLNFQALSENGRGDKTQFSFKERSGQPLLKKSFFVNETESDEMIGTGSRFWSNESINVYGYSNQFSGMSDIEDILKKVKTDSEPEETGSSTLSGNALDTQQNCSHSFEQFDTKIVENIKIEPDDTSFSIMPMSNSLGTDEFLHLKCESEDSEYLYTYKRTDSKEAHVKNNGDGSMGNFADESLKSELRLKNKVHNVQHSVSSETSDNEKHMSNNETRKRKRRSSCSRENAACRNGINQNNDSEPHNKRKKKIKWGQTKFWRKQDIQPQTESKNIATSHMRKYLLSATEEKTLYSVNEAEISTIQKKKESNILNDPDTLNKNEIKLVQGKMVSLIQNLKGQVDSDLNHKGIVGTSSVPEKQVTSCTLQKDHMKKMVSLIPLNIRESKTLEFESHSQSFKNSNVDNSDLRPVVSNNDDITTSYSDCNTKIIMDTMTEDQTLFTERQMVSLISGLDKKQDCLPLDKTTNENESASLSKIKQMNTPSAEKKQCLNTENSLSGKLPPKLNQTKLTASESRKNGTESNDNLPLTTLNERRNEVRTNFTPSNNKMVSLVSSRNTSDMSYINNPSHTSNITTNSIKDTRQAVKLISKPDDIELISLSHETDSIATEHKSEATFDVQIKTVATPTKCRQKMVSLISKSMKTSHINETNYKDVIKPTEVYPDKHIIKASETPPSRKMVSLISKPDVLENKKSTTTEIDLTDIMKAYENTSHKRAEGVTESTMCTAKMVSLIQTSNTDSITISEQHKSSLDFQVAAVPKPTNLLSKMSNSQVTEKKKKTTFQAKTDLKSKAEHHKSSSDSQAAVAHIVPTPTNLVPNIAHLISQSYLVNKTSSTALTRQNDPVSALQGNTISKSMCTFSMKNPGTALTETSLNCLNVGLDKQIYICLKCRYGFTSKDRFETHTCPKINLPTQIRTGRAGHNESTSSDKLGDMFFCSNCRLVFTSKDSFTAHMYKEMHMHQLNYKDKALASTLISNDKPKDPKTAVKKSEPFLNYGSTADNCFSPLTHKESIESKAYSCWLCMLFFDEPKHLAEHFKKHEIRSVSETNDSNKSDNIVYKCDICFDLTYIPRHRLLLHQHLSRDRSDVDFNPLHKKKGKLYACMFCGESFKFGQLLEFHFNIHHVSTRTVTEQVSDNKNKETASLLHTGSGRNKKYAIGDNYLCSTCKQSFVSKYHYENHSCQMKSRTALNQHDDVRSVELVQDSDRLNERDKEETDSEVFDEEHLKCWLCYMSFTDTNDLTSHFASHALGSPGDTSDGLKFNRSIYQCDICDVISYIPKDDLMLHEHVTRDRLHRPFSTALNSRLKLFACVLCGKKFRFKRLLEIHFKGHQGDSIVGAANTDRENPDQ